jgi:hypothetical protein
MNKNTKAWAFTAKVIRINHNRDVKKYFNPKTNNLSLSASRGRQALRDSMLIYPKDSALDILNKQIHFRLVLANDDSALVEAESWLTKHGTDIEQLVIIYRPKNKMSGGKYSITIPHFNGSKNIKPPAYTKGNTPVVFNLKDRTKLVVNAESEKEGKRVINVLLKFVDPKFIVNKDAWVLPSKTKIKRQEMRPHRGDYFKKGHETKNPNWRIYF